MNTHRYILQPYKGPASRTKCPACGKPREFARYLDTETGDLLPDHVGRCNREDQCGYHHTPAQYFEEIRPIDGRPGSKPNARTAMPQLRRTVQYLPLDLVQKSMAAHAQNHFAIYLTALFGQTIANRIIGQYFLGTSKYWIGATVFWQIDEQERAHQAKVMLYNPETGRRVKDDGSKVFFAGKSLLKDSNANLVQCFFGQHLLRERPAETVAIVESEKTACIASVYFPRLVWIATGGKHGIRWTDRTVSACLRGRSVLLFPDLGAFEQWNEKAAQISRIAGCRVSVSDLLECSADDEQRNRGLDLADFLIHQDQCGLAINDHGYPVMWDCS